MSQSSSKAALVLKSHIKQLNPPMPQAMLINNGVAMLASKLEDVDPTVIEQWCADLALDLLSVADPTVTLESLRGRLDA